MERWIKDASLTGDEAKAKALLARVEPIEVQPGARSRVWARMERPERAERPAFLRIALYGAATGALAVVLLLVLAPKPVPPVAGLALSEVASAATIESERGEASPAIAGANIQKGRTLRTRAGGGAVLRAPELGTLRLSASTALAIDDERGLSLRLLSGSLERSTDAVAKLELVAGSFVIASEGSFRAVLAEDGEIEVEVYSGRATVRGPGRSETLAAGEKFTSATAPALASDTTSETASVTRKPRPRNLPGPGRGPDRVRDPEDAAALYRRAQSEPDAEVAIQLFDRIATTDNEYSEIAGHQAARLIMRRGRLRDAANRFDKLLARFPNGAYAPEGQLNAIECRLGFGDLSAAARDLDRYLASRPATERSPELRFLRAELFRRQGQCEQALPEYRAALGSRRDESASYFLAWCRIELGDRAGGKLELQKYLERYPDGRHATEARGMK